MAFFADFLFFEYCAQIDSGYLAIGSWTIDYDRLRNDPIEF